jgi:pimeloyl-ACP methyl ester carboxylesterase
VIPVMRPDGVLLHVRVDEGSAPVAVLGHGAGSTSAFVRACLADAVRSRGWRVATYEHRGHGPVVLRDPQLLSLQHIADDLGAVAEAVGASAVGGISLGAHAAVHWAARQPPGRVDTLMVVCPAWTGTPDRVAAANAQQADRLESLGLQGCLEEVRAHAPPWLAREVSAWWSSHDLVSLCAVLRTLAGQAAPDEPMLAALDAPMAVAVLHDDPLHPAEVGRRWAQLAPSAALGSTTLAELGADRAALGAALGAALDALQSSA